MSGSVSVPHGSGTATVPVGVDFSDYNVSIDTLSLDFDAIGPQFMNIQLKIGGTWYPVFYAWFESYMITSVPYCNRGVGYNPVQDIRFYIVNDNYIDRICDYTMVCLLDPI
jgi:hypothetical protein